MITWYPRSRCRGPADPAPGRPGFAEHAPPGPVGFRPTGARGDRRFAAVILVDEDWTPDVEAVAVTTAVRFPEIGRIEAVPAAGRDSPAAVAIDGALVTVRRLPGRVPADWLAPPLKPVRHWDPELPVRRHVGAVEISCGGELPGLEGAEAYAAAVHFVAAAVCQVVRAGAVLWREGWVVSEPAVFAEAADAILAGRMPVGSWVGLATVPPKGFAPERAAGVVTYGLSQFIGRELEFAPMPGSTRAACRAVSRIARMALERRVVLVDGQHLTDPRGEFAVTVRERGSWLRHDVPAFVLVPAGSVLDVDAPDPGNEAA